MQLIPLSLDAKSSEAEDVAYSWDPKKRATSAAGNIQGIPNGALGWVLTSFKRL